MQVSMGDGGSGGGEEVLVNFQEQCFSSDRKSVV